jgi:hypothetical protein
MPSPIYKTMKYCFICDKDTNHKITVKPGVWEDRECFLCGERRRVPFIGVTPMYRGNGHSEWNYE